MFLGPQAPEKVTDSHKRWLGCALLGLEELGRA